MSSIFGSNSLFGHADMIARGLDGSWRKAQVISNNLANAETANFKASTLDFQSALREQMQQSQVNKNIRMNMTREKHMVPVAGSQPYLRTKDELTMKMDGNNVDVEQEMVDMAENNIYYNFMISKVSKDLGRLKTVLAETK